jgi:type II secretory pathway pseudopilin PulG
MDAFLTSVVAGVMVAVAGAIAAFYFGGVREKQKQEFERQQEQQRQQEEQNRRRAEVLTKIQAQTSGIVEAVRSWAAKAVSLDLENPPLLNYSVFRPNPKGEEITTRQASLLKQYKEILQQRDSISQKMSLLRHYYEEQLPSLGGEQRNLFESFDKEFYNRYGSLSSQLPDYETIEEHVRLAAEPMERAARALVNIGGKDRVVNKDREMEALAKEGAGIPEAARHARDWDFRFYQDAFDKEIGRLTGSNS